MTDDTDELVEGVDERRKAISDILRIWVRAGWKVANVLPEELYTQWFATCPHVARQKQFTEITITNMQTGEKVTLQ